MRAKTKIKPIENPLDYCKTALESRWKDVTLKATIHTTFTLWEGLDNRFAAKSLQSCPTLCDPIDGSPPGSPVPGILQARTLECVAISSSNAWKWKVKVKSLSRVQLLATTWTAPPGSSVHGIFQARGQLQIQVIICGTLTNQLKVRGPTILYFYRLEIPMTPSMGSINFLR